MPVMMRRHERTHSFTDFEPACGYRVRVNEVLKLKGEKREAQSDEKQKRERQSTEYERVENTKDSFKLGAAVIGVDDARNRCQEFA